jgi:3-oxoacyl-[acyl-carrier protein] reductase
MKVLVIGGSKGLGAEITHTFLDRGHDVLVISRSVGSIEKKWENQDKRLRIVLADISSYEKFTSFVHMSSISFEQFDVVVNCLGGNLGERNFLSDYGSYESVFWHNFGYVVEVNRRCLAGMIDRRFGKICNISSVSALENHGPPQYGAAKSALNAYTKAVGRICAESGVTMFGVMPGALLDSSGYWSRVEKSDPKHFESFRTTRLPSKRFDSSKHIANLITFIVEQEDSNIYSGSMLLVDGGISRTYL